ncbi:MAG: SIS domain-containing protein [Kiritimatiellae bacterium]|jgi:D-sedoheptulose 7-phosphate isomerase|nr:SIS domain-containing protein [Kiritimatiellia bacterium]
MSEETKLVDCGALESFVDGALIAIQNLKEQKDVLASAAELFVSTLRAGHKILTIGNGGSAAEALHMAEELSGRYKKNRVALPGICLCADCTALTCICNDYGADYIFSRQVEALGSEGDLLVVFSTSGNSQNLITAVESARAKGCKVMTLLGRDGGKLKGQADIELIIKADASAHIQEAHQVVLHALLEQVEQYF